MISHSLTPDTGVTPAGVGLSDPHYSAKRRQMLDLINRLHSTGVQLDMDLPVIAVIGSQSAGKSSLIESISGITLPRASGTCTRVPTECRLISSPEPWQCIITLRFITDVNGQPLRQIRNEPFGGVIHEKSHVEERIRRAQRALLNPSTGLRDFLEGHDEDPLDRELSFSKNCVCLEISGPDVADLSFVDLPGLIASVGKGGNDGDIELVEGLVKTYIERPSCIILLTVACETDFENQRAHRLTKQYDPEGKRTIGVLTKPDRIPSGEEENWLRFIRNENEPLENGWFSVKQPDSRSLQSGITWPEARAAEQQFFSVTSPWSNLDPMYQQRLGTANLTERLSDILSSLITKRLPMLQEELQELLRKTDDALRALPKPPSIDPLTEILNVISEFARDIAKHVDGLPNRNGLLQAIRPAQETFKQTIRKTAPDFRPSERGDAEVTPLLPPSFLDCEERCDIYVADREPIYIDEVMQRAQEAIARELPDHYPFVVCTEYILTIVSQWEFPTLELFDSVQRTLIVHMKKLIALHFGKYAHGGLQQHVTLLVIDFIKTCGENTLHKLKWFLELEKQPRTLNEHYYSDYRDKFIAYYRGGRRHKTKDLANRLRKFDSSRSNSVLDTTFVENTTAILNGLRNIGLPNVKAVDLPRLFASDPYEPAINIMATVRAYFQVAFKRFVDNVPMAIDYELILGLDRERALENALLKGLGIVGTDAHQKCKEYLQEAPNVISRREELGKKRARLLTARQELVDLWL